MTTNQLAMLDLRDIYQTGSAIESNRLQNEYLRARTAETERKAKRENQLAALMPGVMEGDQDAIRAMAVADPERAGQALDVLSKASKEQREKLKYISETTARLLGSVEALPEAGRPLAYRAARLKAREMGLPVDNVPEDYDPNFVQQQLAEALETKDLLDRVAPAPKTMGVGNQVVRVQGESVKPLYTAPKDPNLVAAPDQNSPTGFSMQPERPGLPAAGPRQMRVESDGKGGFVVSDGPVGAGLAKPTASEIDTQLKDNALRLDRVKSLKGKFKPEYLQLGTQLDMGAADWQERLGGKLTPERQAELTAYSQFRSDAANELTQTLKAMSGAAVTPQEAERLLTAIGDPGNDGPTKFMSKVEATERAIKLANARLRFIRQNGLDKANFGGISLDGMTDIIRKRGNELDADLRRANPQAQDAEIQEAVRLRLTEEFGV